MSEINSIYRATPRKIYSYLEDCLEAGLVPFLQSSPGMGKSSLFKKLAKKWGLWMIDHRLSTSDPTDLSGLPRFDDNGKAYFAPFADLFPLEDTPIPNGYQGWYIFFDEFNSGKKDVQAACYKTILDKMTGQHKLHPAVAMGCAGNLDTDRAIVNPIGTAMQSRVISLEMVLSHEEWMEDVALAESYDYRIVAFLNEYKSYLMDFKPDHTEKTFCCPRTWEFMNRLIKDKQVLNEKMPLYAGTITSGVAVKFVQFVKVFSEIVKVADILKDPTNCPVPQESALRWATITSMIENMSTKNFGGFAQYAVRFPLDFRVLFFRAILVKDPELRRHPDFSNAARETIKYLVS